MFSIGVLLVGKRISRVRRYGEANGESSIYKEGLIRHIIGSGDVLPGW